MQSSQGVCDRTSNNKYLNCPARMADGRHFTDYRPSYVVNNLMRYENNVFNDYDYRQFMIHNATNLMKVNSEYAHMKNKCEPCNAKQINVAGLCTVTRDYSVCRPLDPRGLGERSVAGSAPLRNYNPALQQYME